MVLLILVMVALTFLPLHAEQPAEVPGRESLRGLIGVEIFVEPVPIEIEQSGLQTVTLQREIKERLHKAGIRALTERERLGSPPAPMLIVHLHALHDRIGRYFYSMDLLLTQRVRLKDQITSDMSAVTWFKLGEIGTVADDNVKHIRDQVLHKVDQFIKDFHAVNPT